MDFAPSLGFLLFKVTYFLMVVYLTGWALYPAPVFKQSRIASWIFCQSVGTSFLLLCAFNLVNFDIPAKWVVIVPPVLLVLRVIVDYLYPQKARTYQDCDSFSYSLGIYVFGTLVITAIYLMPFILTMSSGLYAYGGGDHSSYFRVSDLVVNQSLKDIILSWHLSWPPKISYEGMDISSLPSLFPPMENWSINSLIYYIKYARQSMTFANQTIGVPFLALGMNNPEESYTAGVTVYLLLMCWSASVFVLTMLRRISGTWLIAIAASAIALASPAMSLVLKQAIPAIYAWGSMLICLSVMLYFLLEKNEKMVNPIPIGISIAASYLMYLPAIVVSVPLWIFLFIKDLHDTWKEKSKWLLTVGLMLIVFTNVEADRPVKLFLSNATGAILNYGLKLYHLPFTLLGVADFESILNYATLYPLALMAGVVVLMGLCLFLWRAYGQIKMILIFAVPILLSIAYYWLKGGHYHVIRMVEFLSIVLVAMSIVGFATLYRSSSRSKYFILAILSVFVVNTMVSKTMINKQIISATPNPRAGIVLSTDIQIAKQFQHDFLTQKKMPLIYWMGWGAVPFANHEIVFRKLQYVEAFEYDYSYLKKDILAPEYLNNAILLYPAGNLPDILSVDPVVLDNKKFVLKDKTMQKVGVGSGAAILGTGWIPPALESKKTVRYLRSEEEGGLVIWSEKDKVVQIEIKASSLKPGMALTLRRPDDQTDIFSADKFIFRGENETSEAYFLRLTDTVAKDKEMADFLYCLKVACADNMKETPAQFNKMLAESKLFKQFVIYNIEKESPLTKALEKTYHSQQLTYPLIERSMGASTIKFNLYLHKGANVVRFIVRDNAGRRSGRDSLTGIFYHPEVNVQAILLWKIHIGAPTSKLEQLV